VRSAKSRRSQAGLEGERVSLEESNSVAYFLHCIRENKPEEDPLSVRLNVQVVEILSAAR
jgi:hypothetical protein